MAAETIPPSHDGRPWRGWDGRFSLPAILTAARAGAVDHAWAMFHAGGYDRRETDPAALAVRGRLLKENARRATGEARTRAFAEAAAAYGAADGIAPQPYTRANLASLLLLSGDAKHGCAVARGLLDWLDREPDLPETPYYLAAARAEAMLVCGDAGGAETALGEAVAREPQAWEDHAATLHQMRLIAETQGLASAWLDRFRPPRSLHYAGHLGTGTDERGDLRDAIAQVMAAERIGFAYGALAAGADLLIAEGVLAAGAELHLVFATDVESFASQSITPYGADWARRFESCLAAAASVRVVGHVRGGYEPLATRLAADVAMGSAVLNARRLESEPVQLLIADDGPGPFGDGLSTARMGGRWAEGGWRQHVLRWPRATDLLASGRKAQPEGRPDRRLAAMLHISFDGLDHLDEGAFAEALDEVVVPFRQRLAECAIQPNLTLTAGNARLVAFSDSRRAWRYARLLLAQSGPRLPLRIAGHLALAHWLEQPAALVGRGVADLHAIAAAAMPGVLTVSETMASSLFVAPTRGLRAEPVGEVEGIRLFAMIDG